MRLKKVASTIAGIPLQSALSHKPRHTKTRSMPNPAHCNNMTIKLRSSLSNNRLLKPAKVAANATLFIACNWVSFIAHADNSTALSTSVKTAAETDWVSGEESNQSANIKLGAQTRCEGRYVDPYANEPVPDPANTLIYIDAGTADMNPATIELGKGVAVKQGSRLLHAEQMLFDKQAERASLSGNVKIRQTGTLIHGESATVNMIGNEAAFTDGSFLAHKERMRGQAKSIKHEPDGRLVMENGKFTSCDPYDKAWLLSGKKLVIDPANKQGYGRDITVRIGGIPVLYTPYIRFPLGGERQTGLLAPSIATIDGGLDYAQPWYWNIAPNQDATITPRFIQGRGVMLEAEYRYYGYRSRNILQVAGLPDDQGGNDPDIDRLINDNAFTEQALRPQKGENRWILQGDHRGGIQRPWYSRVDYGRVSDINYLRDLPAASFAVANETFLKQSLQLGYIFPNWHLAANFYNAQNLLNDIDSTYRRVPQIVADGQYQLGNWDAKLNHEYVNFDHRQDQRLNGKSLITGERFSTNYQINYPSEAAWGFVKPTVGAQTVSYRLDKQALRQDAKATPSLATHYASLDAGLTFEHASGLQVFTPRLFYLFRQYTNHDDLFNITTDGQSVNFDTSPLTFSYHQLFRSRRFAGGDRLDDANQLTLGLTHQLYRTNGEALWDISLGQTVYFEDRRININSQQDTLEESDIAGQFTTYINPYMRALGSVQYNLETNKVMRASTGFYYHKNSWLFNLDYRFAREQPIPGASLTQEIDQLDLSFYAPAGAQWQWMGRLLYDLDDQRELEAFVGLEYGSCCYRIRTVARRWLDTNLALSADVDRRPYDQGLFFEIELIGLGASGKRLENLLKDSIFGYKQKR